MPEQKTTAALAKEFQEMFDKPNFQDELEQLLGVSDLTTEDRFTIEKLGDVIFTICTRANGTKIENSYLIDSGLHLITSASSLKNLPKEERNKKIRELSDQGELSQTQLAKLFDLTQSMISQIVRKS